ncbi:MAG TPA: peptide chain release factor N(5)-glutamine methyltransferase [Gammaproteobacteria bacterium]|jgi:release factor glutamine methyltransferase
MDIAHTLKQIAERLATVSDSARLDAELLLCHALGRPRSYLYTWPEQELDEEQAEALEKLVERRQGGEPVAHILGKREFWSLELAVSTDTLIPRPETELLVEAALARIPEQAEWAVADLGTGSGAIALAIASERPRCRITAVERSAGALAMARQNAQRLGLGNVEFLQGDWFAPLAGRRFQVILSNPPYIPDNDPHLSRGDLRFEPRSALAAGPDGLADLRQLVSGAPAFLCPPGWLLLEHGYDQGGAVTGLLDTAGYAEVADLTDLQGHGRVAVGRWTE